ncbi:MAG: N-(5'-phosphoribosyl)anthranilate isomerase [Elusimicrobia bacterium CG11_big_fil_rev_8_21_14_0_20_64_6]|nr:MAG: N-(5'-phosphoribosyl)anthranilate isomerase [Elusimicrobia bacterium CG11_big_fil_rev_8_21_14_0_20_64_6]
MRVKVCGVTRPQDARLAAKLGAWAVGMIFVPNTPRYLTPPKARKVRAAIPKGVLAIGVFRHVAAEELLRVVHELRLDAVQIYGAVPRGIKVRVIQAVTLDARPLRGKMVLIEPARSDADRRAGRGPSVRAQRKAWKTAESWCATGARVILAGGLTPENAADAAAAAKPWALDVSSGVERAPGIKRAPLLRAFFLAANRKTPPL